VNGDTASLCEDLFLPLFVTTCVHASPNRCAYAEVLLVMCACREVRLLRLLVSVCTDFRATVTASSGGATKVTRKGPSPSPPRWPGRCACAG